MFLANKNYKNHLDFVIQMSVSGSGTSLEAGQGQ
jgi:hypothetical protein